MTRHAGLLLVAFVATLALLVGGWALIGRPGSAGVRSSASPSPTARASGAAAGSPSLTPTVPPSFAADATDAPTITLSGAGDIARCRTDGAKLTSDLLLDQPGWIFTAGDNAYEAGSLKEYRECYAPTWGRLLDRTILPAVGNHDWLTKNAAGYREYFGARASPDGTTWYSTTLGTWHVIVLDSSCEAVGGCGVDSPQGAWLAKDLAASRQVCTIAIWHAPRFSSGFHGNATEVAPFWDALYAARTDLVINGHDHDYERFGPQNPAGVFERDRGIREIVVGTGGAELRDFTHGAGNGLVRIAQTYGVLQLTLHPTGYDWAFLATDGTVKDSGSDGCH